MKLEEPEIAKLYYGIGEVAEKLNVNSSLIRFWEKEFKEIRPKKSKSGKRYFTQADILLLQKIHRLVKEEGYTLQGARDALSIPTDKKFNPTEIRKKLESIRKELLLIEKDF